MASALLLQASLLRGSCCAHRDVCRRYPGLGTSASVTHAAVGIFLKLAGLAGLVPPLVAVPLLLGRLVLRDGASLPLGMLPLLPASTIACHALASARGSALNGCACNTRSWNM